MRQDEAERGRESEAYGLPVCVGGLSTGFGGPAQVLSSTPPGMHSGNGIVAALEAHDGSLSLALHDGLPPREEFLENIRQQFGNITK